MYTTVHNRRYFSWVMFIVATLGYAMIHGVEVNEHKIALWQKPVAMDRTGVTEFFNKVFNVRGFGNYFGGPLIDFLEHSKHTSDPLTFTLRIMDLFHVRMKEATWLNAYDVYVVCEALKLHVAPLLQKALDLRLTKVERTLYKSLLTRFRDLKTNPEAFIHDVAIDVVALADTSEISHLRGLCIGLIEGMLDRLICSPEDQEEAWRSVKNIAESLHNLYKAHIITDAPTLNHCLWSLVYRFSYIIETVGEDFSFNTYHLIKQDIAYEDSIIFSFPDDREGLMNSRAQWLRSAVISGEVRARQAHEGSWIAPMN